MKPNAYLRLTGRQWQVTKRLPNGKRLIVNLHTDSLIEARRKRDKLLAELALSSKPRTHDEEAEAWRAEIKAANDVNDEDAEEAISGLVTDWAESIEPKVGTQRAVELARLALGQTTPVTAHLEAFMVERPCAVATQIARRAAIKALPFKSIQAVTSKAAGAYVTQLTQSGITAATVNTRVSQLRIYWAFLVSKDVVEVNPWVGKSVRRDRRFKKRSGSGVWTFAEVAKMLLEVEPEETRSLVEVLVYSGCRVGELAELKVALVHAEYFEIIDGKSRNAERRVYLPKRLMAALHKRCAGQAPGQHVFMQGLGARIVTKRISKALKKLFPEHQTESRRNALKTCHGLRKLWSTVAEQAGCPVHLIQAAMGHERGQLVFQVYSAGPSVSQVKEVFLKVAERLDEELMGSGAEPTPLTHPQSPQDRQLGHSRVR